MKNFFKKAVAVILTVATCATCVSIFASCGLEDQGEQVDTSRRQLYVWTYKGGYGSQWLWNAKRAYEALNPEVQVMITDPKTQGGSITSTEIKKDKYELYFTENVEYFNLMADSAMGDITEAMTTPNAYDGGKTIESKLTTEQKNYYKIEDKYYGLPHYSGNYGITYNVKLFRDNNWYFNGDVEADTLLNKSPFDENYLVEGPSDTKSKGPDGISGTYDDGLPATYEQLIALMRYIANTNKNVKPVTWTGKYSEQYMGYTISAAIADFEGVEQYSLDYSFNGTATSLGTIDQSGNFVKDQNPTVITEANGYELARQQGKYEALKLFDQIITGDGFYDKTLCANNNDEQTTAQLRFIRGQAAMLFEGVWWQNESEANFRDLNTTKADYEFAWMPFPKASSDKVGVDKSVILDCMRSACFMKNGISEQAKADAIDFIKFCYSDEQLVNFTKTTGTFKAVSYEVPSADLDTLTNYEKSLYYHKQASDLCFDVGTSDLYTNNQSDFNSRYLRAKLTVDGSEKEFSTPVVYLLKRRINEGKSANFLDYFKGLYAYDQNKWATSYSK